MAYNIAIMVEILEQDQHHLSLNCKNIIESFLETARSLSDMLLPSPYFTGTTLHDQFTDDAHMAENMIEAHIMDQILLPSHEYHADAVDSLLEHLPGVFQELKSLIETRLEILDHGPELQPDLPLDHLTPEQGVVRWYQKLDPCTKNDIPDIFQDDFQKLKVCLAENSPKLRIICIDGSAGMGKRTLARRLYNDPSIATLFRTRAWVTSPFEENEKGCLLNLLEGLGKLTYDMRLKTVEELHAYIRKALRHIKYFIVIHDVMYKKNLVTFARLFRNYSVGARILFTTSGIDEGTLSTCVERYEMRLLTDSESWILLGQKVFGREHCPGELERVGKNIMQLCKGIPQVVSMVAGVLATSEMTTEAWEIVATALDSKLKSEDIESRQGELLFLIYYHLPLYLRPCLLYLGAFYESRDIKASTIIKLWIAEGFVKQSAGECLEDVAETYLRILIDKNLLHLTREEPNGRVKAFQLQVALRAGYWWLASKEKFLGSKYMHDFLEESIGKIYEEKLARRVSAHGLCQLGNESELPLHARSFLSVSGASRRQVSTYLKLRLLRVLEVFQLEFYQFPEETMKKVLLRYLALSCHSNLRNSFSALHNLQTLILRRLPAFRAFSLPSDLWGLTQLRHVKCKENFVLVYPKTRKEVVHVNLQTLSNMQLFGVTNQFLTKIPNVRNLGIFCNIPMESVFDLARLDKLENLKCSSDWSLASRKFLYFLTLPQSLRKLNLTLCRIPSEFMKTVGSLPNLELLKLQKSDFLSVNPAQSAPAWETAEGDFPQLVSLEMLDLNLVHWRAKATHLPKLKHLVVRNCYAMVEIPSDIGNIQTLELIQVNETSPSALVSAMQINKRQECLGNNFLQIRTHKVV